MRIMLVDDNLRHRKAGKKQLEEGGHDVIVLSEYAEAWLWVSRGEQFDVALLDLLMPAEAMTLGSQAMASFFGKPLDAGFPLALALAQGGVPKIAVATDTGHHDHPTSAMVDWFIGKPLVVNGATVLIMHAPLNEDGTKNWSKVLELLVGH